MIPGRYSVSVTTKICIDYLGRPSKSWYFFFFLLLSNAGPEPLSLGTSIIKKLQGLSCERNVTVLALLWSHIAAVRNNVSIEIVLVGVPKIILSTSKHRQSLWRETVYWSCEIVTGKTRCEVTLSLIDPRFPGCRYVCSFRCFNCHSFRFVRVSYEAYRQQWTLITRGS